MGETVTKKWTALKLSMILMLRPTWRVLLCSDSVIPPSPWTDKFYVYFNKKHRTINITGDLT